MKHIFSVLFFSSMIYAQTLDSLINYALKHSIIIKQSKEALKLSHLNKKASKQKQFGEIDLVSSYTHYNIERTLAPITPSVMKSPTPVTTSKDIYSLGVNYTVPLFTGFAQTRDIQIQALAKEMAKAKLNLTKEELVYNIRSLYLSILALQDMLKAQNLYIKALTKLKNDIAYQVELGKKADIDLLKAQADIEEAIATKENLLGNISISKASLQTLVGKKIKDIQPISFKVTKNHYSKDALLQKALKTSKIKIENLNLKKSDKMIQKSKAALYPQISLNAYYGKNYGEDIKTDDWDNEKIYQVGLNAKYNLIDFGVSNTNIQKAKIAKIQAKLKKQKAILDLKTSITKATSNINKSYAIYKSSLQRYRLSKKASQIEDARYKNDASTLNDLLLAKAKTLFAKAKLIESKYNYKKSIYYLDYILEKGTNNE